MAKKNLIFSIYSTLLDTYGPQGWWPLLSLSGTNPTKTGSVQGYHPEDYSYPKNKNEQFEICVGAILTQNTNWTNVEKALKNLMEKNLLDADKMLKANTEILKTAIRPAGYFNQKIKKLLLFAEFFTSLNSKTPSRKELLDLWGIGPETADTMLLYAYKIPSFVVDAYTKRIVTHLRLVPQKADYNEIKHLFENELEKDFKVFQEFHALLVEHAKHYYSKKPYGQGCFLKKELKSL